MPRWTPQGNISNDLLVEWENYIQALAAHEQGHVDLVVTQHHSIIDAIRGATCETAEAAAQIALTRLRQNDINYDKTTQHGASQGARFP